jgi:hypothetical protein
MPSEFVIVPSPRIASSHRQCAGRPNEHAVQPRPGTRLRSRRTATTPLNQLVTVVGTTPLSWSWHFSRSQRADDGRHGASTPAGARARRGEKTAAKKDGEEPDREETDQTLPKRTPWRWRARREGARKTPRAARNVIDPATNEL